MKIDRGKTGQFTVGVLLTILSIWIGTGEGPDFYRRGFPVNRSIWVIILAVGILLIVHALFKKNKNDSEDL
jgi:hypothetical protein